MARGSRGGAEAWAAYGAEADVVDSIVAGMNHSSFFGGGAFCSHAGAGSPTYKAPLTVTRTTVRDSGAGALIIIGLGPVAIKDSHFLGQRALALLGNQQANSRWWTR